MSKRFFSANTVADTFPECELPRIKFGAPNIMAILFARQLIDASQVVGNSAILIPWLAAAWTCSLVMSSRLAKTAPRRAALEIIYCSFTMPYSDLILISFLKCAFKLELLIEFLAIVKERHFSISLHCRCPGV